MLGWCPASLVVLFVLSLRRLIIRASSGSSRSVGLHIEGRPAEDSELAQPGGGPSSPAAMFARVLPVGYLPPPGKGKEKISEIRYPCGSEYLRATVSYADAVGPSRVEPSFAKTFATRYGPPSGVQIWCPDLLTSYVVLVPKMVCFFEAAFENDLRFPLHAFIKNVLQHFNVFPSQLSPNFWGVLVGLLVFSRDKGLGVPSIALMLDFFSVKETLEGFLYILKQATARPIISDLPSSHKHWKECYFFVGGRHWEYNPTDQDNTLGIPTVWTAPENLREFSVYASRGHAMFLTLLCLRCFQVSVLTLLLRIGK